MRTGNKMLFCSPCIEILAYHQPPAVRRSSLALPCRAVQELVFVGCFFRFAPYGRALVGARCGYMPHKPLGTDQTDKCGKMLPLKRKQGEKCYFSPCALISKSYQQLFSINGVPFPRGKRKLHSPVRHPPLVGVIQRKRAVFPIRMDADTVRFHPTAY